MSLLHGGSWHEEEGEPLKKLVCNKCGQTDFVEWDSKLIEVDHPCDELIQRDIDNREKYKNIALELHEISRKNLSKSIPISKNMMKRILEISMVEKSDAQKSEE